MKSPDWIPSQSKRLLIFVADPPTFAISGDAADYFGLPPDRTVIMGSRIEV